MKHLLRFVLLATLLYVTPALTQWSNNPNVNTPICTAGGNQQNPMIAPDGSGGAIITWYDYRSGYSPHIYAQRVNASGFVQWTADGVAMCTATADQVYPTIASDGSAGAIITWYDNRAGYPNIYAQHVNASGAVQWTANGDTICEAAGTQSSPTIVSDGRGGAIITWFDTRNDAGDIYAQRVNGSGTIQWAANGVAICTASASQLYPQIASDDSGGAIITWWDTRTGNSKIYAQRVDSSGVVQWTPNGVGVCTIGDELYPTIVSDGSGGAIITWRDQRSDGGDIYAQRVDHSGALQWTATGDTICSAANIQSNPTLTSDDSGGAIITWQDQRSGNYDIYAQHVLNSGVVQWTTNGVAIDTTTGDQTLPTIVRDGAGGAIITWEDGRNGVNNVDIYAQRVNASGTVQWTVNGVPIGTAANDKGFPTIVSDGTNGAIITWQDGRTGSNYDIYAQHVSVDAELPIQLASLTATTLTTGVKLDWTTVSETNDLGFYVERRAQNTGAYSTVSDLIPGAGTTLQQHHYQWTDTKVTNGNYGYRLRLVDLDGTTAYSNAIAVTVSGVLGVGDTKSAPTEFALRQNYPNPFNPTTVINYALPKAAYVHLAVYDMLGREVATLVNGAQDAGYKSVEFSAANLPSGIYTYRLTAGTFVEVKKMLMLK